MADLSQYDAQYNALAAQLANVRNMGGMGINFGADAAAQIQQQMQQVVAQRDAAASQVAKTNEDWHRNYQATLGQGTGGDGGASARAEAADRDAREAASAWLTNLLAQYGMSDMSGQVSSLISQWGRNTEVIALKLKDTQEYKDRFKGLLALRAKGITDVADEATYIGLERSYRQVFREAGIQSFIGDAGSANERDAIAKLVGDFSVSVDEVRARVTDAQRVVADTAPEVTDALQRYYNVSASDLVAYTLDPSRARNRINEIANSAIIGGYAARTGLDADVATSEQIASLAGANDVQLQAIMPQLGTARQVADATKRLANLEATDLTDSEILRSEFDLDTGADKKIKGLQSRERARFSGRSAVTAETLSRGTGV
jgi:hypothetical protein